jgi:medium-chain acyl-[acyl-carrier-protein] hydrolase
MASKKGVVVTFGQQVGRRAIVCIPHAAAGAAVFSPWVDVLGEVATVCAVRLPGRESLITERPLDSVESIVARLMPDVAGIDAAELTLLGHCSGAVIAYELAHELIARGDQRVARLIVSSQQAPSVRPAGHPRWPGFASRQEFVAYLCEAGWTDSQVLGNEKFLDFLLPVITADLRAMSSYSKPPGRRPLPIPIAAVCGKSDDSVSDGELMTWSAETSAGFCASRFDGDHFFLFRPAAELVGFLGKALGADS